jgi:hypothetical protein
LRRVDLTGQKFNRLLVIKRAKKVDSGGRAFWECVCDCGNFVIAEGYGLKSGGVKQCHFCKIKQISIKNTTHGCSPTRLYNIWTNMKTRCSNPNYEMFNSYGGKGISLCSEWESFENFKLWSLSHGYNEKLTIDRIDNSNGYNPDNCKWSTMKQQQNNRTNNHLVKFNGEILTLKQWSEKLNISYPTLLGRFYRGWSATKALTTPIRHCNKVASI